MALALFFVGRHPNCDPYLRAIFYNKRQPGYTLGGGFGTESQQSIRKAFYPGGNPKLRIGYSEISGQNYCRLNLIKGFEEEFRS